MAVQAAGADITMVRRVPAVAGGARRWATCAGPRPGRHASGSPSGRPGGRAGAGDQQLRHRAGGVDHDLRAERRGHRGRGLLTGRHRRVLGGEPRPDTVPALAATTAALPEDQPRWPHGRRRPRRPRGRPSPSAWTCSDCVPTRFARHGTVLTALVATTHRRRPRTDDGPSTPPVRAGVRPLVKKRLPAPPPAGVGAHGRPPVTTTWPGPSPRRRRRAAIRRARRPAIRHPRFGASLTRRSPASRCRATPNRRPFRIAPCRSSCSS